MNIPQIEIQDAKRHLDEQSCLFVDVRDSRAYAEAHVPGAVRLHDGNVEEFVRDTDKSRRIVVYCYHGNSSLGAAGYLLENGFAHAVSMAGGFEAWRTLYEVEGAR